MTYAHKATGKHMEQEGEGQVWYWPFVLRCEPTKAIKNIIYDSAEKPPMIFSFSLASLWRGLNWRTLYRSDWQFPFCWIKLQTKLLIGEIVKLWKRLLFRRILIWWSPLICGRKGFRHPSKTRPPAFPSTKWWGIDNCMWSNDYPHPNSTWPNSRKIIERDLGHLPAEKLTKLLCTNVSKLYQLETAKPV